MSHPSERTDYLASLVRPLARAGMGIPNFSHPLHPATVHMPIGLLSLSFVLDSVQVIPRLAQGLTYVTILRSSAFSRHRPDKPPTGSANLTRFV